MFKVKQKSGKKNISHQAYTNGAKHQLMSKSTLNEAEKRLEQLNLEKSTLDGQIINKEIELHLTSQTTRQQTRQLQEIRELGTTLIRITHNITETENLIRQLKNEKN